MYILNNQYYSISLFMLNYRIEVPCKLSISYINVVKNLK